jgi:hydrogenase expression/formation protein HypE
MRDVTRGGLATILNEFSKSSKIDITIDEESLPVTETVLGLCDILGLDPLYMGNEGKFIAIVAQEDAQSAVELLRQNPITQNACIIGSVNNLTTDSTGGKVTMIMKNGASRRLSILHGEGLPRIC